jgi:hypothetical protein
MFYAKMFPEVVEADMPIINSQWIFDTSMLVCVDAQDLHLALIAHSEYNFGVGGLSGDNTWILNENGLEQNIIDR